MEGIAPGRARRAWWAVAVWLAFQLTLTSLPASALPESQWPFRIDWLVHFCMYFGLGLLIARAGSVAGWSPGRLALIWMAMAVFGVLDELHEELFIPGRGAELMDWVMDAAGSWLGLVLGNVLMRTPWAARLLR